MIVPDWFDEPETKSIKEQVKEAYAEYIKNFDYKEFEEGYPMSLRNIGSNMVLKTHRSV
ncbi:hypothetical protein M2651_05655 [Clostridium sp. SYSU_GA19001]|uniref:hypothetical protein n=1 Tax=Clostridium caldaquaticum TaxID=2940653 RepID=UPI002076E408|nr:hypothetical protein [Clostridium caldaquaticum]MCM8710510.1 hypothetical protein [Clostridium caldaquaticum]